MGHLGGELSLTDVAVALYYKYLNYDPENPKWPDRDRLVLSKGHCSETLYTIFADLGMFTMDYMVEHFETLNTARFGMHSNRKYVDAIELSAGSLGHGLPVSVGMCLGARKQKQNWNTFVIVGDGELDEGSNWEAIMAAGHYKLNNLTCIVDKNGLQMTGPTAQVMNLDPLDKIFEAFNWSVIEIEDGNDMVQICDAFDKLEEVRKAGKPVAIIAHTVKGKGVKFMENVVKWHGGGIAEGDYKLALEQLTEEKEAAK